ncbi:MAG: hypothetical protein OES32_06745 [Acidobacteriota bacterium]|nr:hypothetical protein [Acidobacteriota bacterium]MDH3523268.1 hypothetical protein [Acidobacteriota bacterium]
MQRAELPPCFAEIRDRHSAIYAIVSPPRCSSTAFARVFWEQPTVRFYCHEPFETTYYMGRDQADVVAKMQAPLDLDLLKSTRGDGEGRALVIKEMPYQVGARFPLLAALATKPLVFLMRDPRLNIASRMAKKLEVGDSPLFPAIESGWELWRTQIEWCRDAGIPHVLVDSTDFRNQPGEVFPQVFAHFGLEFSPAMLEWRPCPEVELDNLGGRHRHLYGEVLASAGIKPDSDPIPPLESFPEEDGWRDHVARCLDIYAQLAASDRRVGPAGPAPPRPPSGDV